MDKSAIEALGLKMVEAVRDAVKRATDPLHAKIAELEAREPLKGEKGEAGKDFDPASLQPHIDGLAKAAKDIEEALAKRVDDWIASIPAPQDGKDADPEFILAAVAKAVAEIPKPKDGADAKPVDYAKVFEKVAEEAEKYAGLAVAALPKPRDGESVHPDTVKAMVSEAVEKAVAKIRIPEDGKRGEDGKDALQIEPLPSIDESKSYPRGTYATHLGGTIKAVRNTDPIGPQGLEAAGWQVMSDGVAGIVVTQDEQDPRKITVSAALTSGLKATTDFRIPMMVYREVWKDGETYQKGDVVTWGGSAWHCQAETKDKPGTSPAFKLMVKSGRDGKDFDAAKPSGPVRLK